MNTPQVDETQDESELLPSRAKRHELRYLLILMLLMIIGLSFVAPHPVDIAVARPYHGIYRATQ